MKKPRICVTIVDSDIESILEIEKLIDLFEVRLDLVGPEWPKIVKYLKKPWIACNRSQEEGGKGGTNDVKRVEELLWATEVGASIVDIEHSTPNLSEYIPLIKARAKCLLSFHDAFGTPSFSSLVNIAESQIKAGADICKIVTSANKFEDNLTILKLINKFPEAKIVAFSMGEAGRLSRILSPLAGGYFTYASLKKGRESASGQIPVIELSQIYKYIRDDR
jgi:3-dehydroquinate dehydratase type I